MITNQTILAIFDLQLAPNLQSLKSIGLLVQEKKRKIDFQYGGHPGFPIRRILSILDLQVVLIHPAKFQVNWPLGSGEEAR